LACLLLACGQRGPLYLPEETAAPAASQAAPDEQDAESEDADVVREGGFEGDRESEP
jgi:predicted small lipoprotein YifL